MSEATKDKRPKGARYGEAFFCLFYLLFMVGMIIMMKIRYDAVYTVGQVDFNDPGRMDAHRFTFGIMLAFLLVFGDCFHLIPRIVYDTTMEAVPYKIPNVFARPRFNTSHGLAPKFA